MAQCEHFCILYKPLPEFLRYKMTVNQPPKPTEYEPLPIEKKDSLVDRFFIQVGDLVIQNFTFLVFIAVVWGLFIILILGGAALVYVVTDRFIDMVAREQQRQIIQEQPKAITQGVHRPSCERKTLTTTTTTS